MNRFCKLKSQDEIEREVAAMWAVAVSMTLTLREVAWLVAAYLLIWCAV